MRNMPLVPVVLLTVAALVSPACGRSPVVGVIRPVTGLDRTYGLAVDRGVEFAVDTRTASPGLPTGFRMVRVDTESHPEKAAFEVQRLVEDHGVRIVLGAVTTAEAEAMLPVIEEERVICLSPTARGGDLAKRSRYFYRLAPTDEIEGSTAARHLVDERGATEVVIFTDDSRLTRGVEAEFRRHFEMKYGGRILDTIHLGEEKWRSRAADVVHAFNPEAAYIVGHATSILDVLSHLAAQDFQGTRCTTSTVYVADVLGTAGAVADGVVFPLPMFDVHSESERVHTFAERYAAKYGRSPDIFEAHGFDAMSVAMESLSRSESLYTPEIRRTLSYGLDGFLGVTGTIAFNEWGEVPSYPVMHCIRHGQVRPCSTLRQETRESIRSLAAEFGA